MSIRLNKEQRAVLSKLEYGEAVLKEDEDSVMLCELRPGQFPCLVMRIWDKEDFLY